MPAGLTAVVERVVEEEDGMEAAGGFANMVAEVGRATVGGPRVSLQSTFKEAKKVAARSLLL